MRIPSDLPADPSPRRRHRARWWLIGFVVVLIILLVSLRSLAGLYTDSLWFSSVRPPQRLLDAAGDQARPLRRVRGDLLRRPVGEPRGVRPHCRSRHRAGPGGRAGAPLPAVRAAVRGADLRGPRLRPGADRGIGDGRAVEQLDPVPPRRQLRRDRPPVPQGHRLLRLRPALLDLRRGLDAGHPDRDAGRLGRVPLLQRRDPAPAWPAAGAAAGEGAHLGAAGPDRARQGGGLRPAALVAGELAGRLRQRRRLHRRARPPAGGDAAHLRVDLRRGDPALQHPAPGLDAPGAGHRDLGLRRAGGRHHLPGAVADAQGHAGAELAGGALHQTQHHGHAGRLRAEQRQGAPVPRQHEHQRQPDRRGRAHHRQHPAVGPGPDDLAADVPAPAGHQVLLLVPLTGRGPLHAERDRARRC